MILQLACDITIAAESAKIGYIEQRLGFSGTAMDLGLLTMTVGPKLAQDLVLTSRVLSGREAAEIGLVSRWAPDEELDDAVEKAAKSIARLPRDGIAIGRATKELVYGSLGLNNDRTIGYVTHSMFTNLRWEEDEHNFFKNRRDIGVSEEIRKRDKYYSGGS